MQTWMTTIATIVICYSRLTYTALQNEWCELKENKTEKKQENEKLPAHLFRLIQGIWYKQQKTKKKKKTKGKCLCFWLQCTIYITFYHYNAMYWMNTACWLLSMLSHETPLKSFCIISIVKHIYLFYFIKNGLKLKKCIRNKKKKKN